LYLYGIKISTNIKQNSVEKYAGKSHIFFEIIFEENFLFFFFRAGPNLAYMVGLDPASPSRSLVQASDPTRPHMRKILRVHEQCEGN
jgi:hypothetical protein